MSKRDWIQLQAYRATGMTPAEVFTAVKVASVYTLDALCRNEQKKLGLDFCPGKGLCDLGTAYLKAAAKEGKRDAAEIATCDELAQRYPAVTVRAFRRHRNECKEAHPEEAAK